MKTKKSLSECNQKNSQKCSDLVWFYREEFPGKVYLRIEDEAFQSKTFYYNYNYTQLNIT